MECILSDQTWDAGMERDKMERNVDSKTKVKTYCQTVLKKRFSNKL